MTEKRFKHNGSLIFENGKPLNTLEVVDLLNTLNDENIQITNKFVEQDKEIQLLRKEINKMWTQIILRSPVEGWQDVIRASKKRIRWDLNEES